jgi:hypothetical protein
LELEPLGGPAMHRRPHDLFAGHLNLILQVNDLQARTCREFNVNGNLANTLLSASYEQAKGA